MILNLNGKNLQINIKIYFKFNCICLIISIIMITENSLVILRKIRI